MGFSGQGYDSPSPRSFDAGLQVMNSQGLASTKLVGAIHPAVWWVLGLAFAVWSAVAENLWSLAGILGINIAIIALLRTRAPWAQSLRFYLFTGILVITIRLVFRVIFNFDSAEDIALNLPSLHLNLGALGTIELFGRVSRIAIETALRDGLRMAAIIMSVGMANSLANPRRLLKSTPSALYEVAAAFVIAINMAPQLISSAKRVRRFSKLRGRGRSRSLLTSIVIPTLEDTIERSMALAASMDARGFGRRGTLTQVQVGLARASSLLAISAFGIGSYLILTSTEIWVASLVLTSGFLALIVNLRLARIGRIKTNYSQQRLAPADIPVLAVALSIAALSIGGVLK